MKWTIAKARERFSELLRQAAAKPQPIYNRARLVAAVISAEAFKEFSAWHAEEKQRSLAEAFEELRAILLEETCVLEAVPRRNRPNHFTDVLNELPR